MTTIDPCPFCGEAKALSLSRYQSSVFVQCEPCGAQGPSRPSDDAAMNAWNFRCGEDDWDWE